MQEGGGGFFTKSRKEKTGLLKDPPTPPPDHNRTAWPWRGHGRGPRHRDVREQNSLGLRTAGAVVGGVPSAECAPAQRGSLRHCVALSGSGLGLCTGAAHSPLRVPPNATHPLLCWSIPCEGGVSLAVPCPGRSGHPHATPYPPLWGGGVGTRPWWLALLTCGGAYWPLAFEPSAMTSRHPHYCGHPHCRGPAGCRNRAGLFRGAYT